MPASCSSTISSRARVRSFSATADYLPVDPAVPPRVANLTPEGGKFRALYFTPEQVQEKLVGWTKTFNDLFP